MFELSIALKYLIPRKRQLSVSLIAFMSVGVISLVVWLVLLFLSITEGIEKNWLEKLTALNAPVRITPTQHYYDSYYYLIDKESGASQYTYKNIAQKALAPVSDPYSPQEDRELPRRFPLPERTPEGRLIDPVKEAYRLLTELKERRKDLCFQDFEMSGALMRLQLLRPNKALGPEESSQSYLTQVSYLATVPSASPSFAKMLLSPTEKDLQHLFYLATHTTEHAREDAAHLTALAKPNVVKSRLKKLVETIAIEELMSTPGQGKIPPHLLPENHSFSCTLLSYEGKPVQVMLSSQKGGNVKVERIKEMLFLHEENKTTLLDPAVPLLVESATRFTVLETGLSDTHRLRFKVIAKLQDALLSGEVFAEHLQIAKAHLRNTTQTELINEEREVGVYIAKSYKDAGVLLGDRGYLSYSSAAASAVQEQRLPIYVAGFYDPGVLSIGNRCILVPPFVTETINASHSALSLDKRESNGLLVWFPTVSDASSIKAEIESAFSQAGIAPFWKVSTFTEYEFAKDLFQQFQSDKYLFTLIAAIILLVACSNIISLLTLLVNDKKREIAILQAMGASHTSIALIFGACGMAMGAVSCVIGAGLVFCTLKHIDSLVQLLSLLQGRSAFNAAFFGAALPNELSTNALHFILWITPLLSLLAGLVPALKACRMRPSDILRSR